ncbi:hypothetical protein RF11_01680 [Thelohanellus kitauei]|uniref:Uncharacterized protein n=1 Tax=Thelohanellus kitauei TaxID=669202 RepID=A0A0C2I9F2_THEKT|nr:hypothetical protein RF11_01680 [Thelohanellus kitauei]
MYDINETMFEFETNFQNVTNNHDSFDKLFFAYYRYGIYTLFAIFLIYICVRTKTMNDHIDFNIEFMNDLTTISNIIEDEWTRFGSTSIKIRNQNKSNESNIDDYNPYIPHVMEMDTYMDDINEKTLRATPSCECVVFDEDDD